MKKNLIITLSLTLTLIIFGLFVFTPAGEAQKQNNILPLLLDIPAPPPPNPYFQVTSDERAEEFYSTENPPPDDAPIQDLLDYWARQSELNSVLNYTIEPSDTVARRIFAEIDKNPELLNEYLNVFSKKPDYADDIKRIYERELNNEEIPDYRKNIVKRWLGLNSDHDIENLERAASAVRDTREYVTNQDQLLALAKIDFERARPILERLVNNSDQPISKTLAHWAFYLNALKEGDSIEADRHREALMKTVEDKNAKPGDRDLAFDALVYGGDFPGRDDWYFSLFEDETLAELRVNGRLYTGLTTLLLREPPDKYVDKMVEFVKSKNQTVRNIAARNLGTLLDKKNPKVIEALLPWLEDPEWAKEYDSERRKLVSALANVKLPESVPGLISMLNEKATRRVAKPKAGVNANANLSSDDMEIVEIEYYPYRGSVIPALARQEDIRAAQPLRLILPETRKDSRGGVVEAIFASGGFTILEQIDALEDIARKNKNEAKTMVAETEKAAEGIITIAESPKVPPKINVPKTIGSFELRSSAGGIATSRPYYEPEEVEPFDPAEIKPLLSKKLLEITEPKYELVSATANRIAYLEEREPFVSIMLRTYMQKWKGAAVNAVLLDDLRSGKADINTIIKLLGIRQELREKQPNEIINAKGKGNPIAIGITACLMENSGEYSAILTNGGAVAAQAKIALLGCARLIRAELPVQTVAGFLNDSNKILALAAERYLESEDSPESRQIIYKTNPNEARILGARYFFGSKENTHLFDGDLLEKLFVSVNRSMSIIPYFLYRDTDEFTFTEAILRKEILENKELLGIYAFENNYVRIYKDRAVFSWEEDSARYRERTLEEKEFDYLKNHLASNNVEELPPFLGSCSGCELKELVMLGQQGGRRVFVSSDIQPGFFEGLEEIFADMRKPPAKLRYWLEKDIVGLEILFEDKTLQAIDVWKNGDDLRLFVNDTQKQKQIAEDIQKLFLDDNKNLGYMEALKSRSKRLAERKADSFFWHQFENNQLGNLIGQPPGFKFILPYDPDEVGYESRFFQNKNTAIEANYEGLYKIENGEVFEFSEGHFGFLVVSEDRNWAIALKFAEEDGEKSMVVIVNLQTNQLTEMELDKYEYVKPTAYLPSLKKFFIKVGNSFDINTRTIKGDEYLALDAATGKYEKLSGEIRPLIQQTSRSLQPTADEKEFWAAIPSSRKEETQIGTYNTQNFRFTPVLKVPRILFSSMNMWVDEANKKIYIIYEGQLLAIPLIRSSELN